MGGTHMKALRRAGAGPHTCTWKKGKTYLLEDARTCRPMGVALSLQSSQTLSTNLEGSSPSRSVLLFYFIPLLSPSFGLKSFQVFHSTPSFPGPPTKAAL